jgi:hypothetical protein
MCSFENETMKLASGCIHFVPSYHFVNVSFVMCSYHLSVCLAVHCFGHKLTRKCRDIIFFLGLVWKLKSPWRLQRKLVHFHLHHLQSRRGFEVPKIALILNIMCFRFQLVTVDCCWVQRLTSQILYRASFLSSQRMCLVAWPSLSLAQWEDMAQGSPHVQSQPKMFGFLVKMNQAHMIHCLVLIFLAWSNWVAASFDV